LSHARNVCINISYAVIARIHLLSDKFGAVWANLEVPRNKHEKSKNMRFLEGYLSISDHGKRAIDTIIELPANGRGRTWSTERGKLQMREIESRRAGGRGRPLSASRREVVMYMGED
ncbi:hypothetical protein PMAYCL1PPCAC_28646, partial [Pristionchus mayeri]